MLNRLFLMSLFAAMTVAVSPALASIKSSSDLADGMQFALDSGTLRVRFWSDGVVRVTYADGTEVPATKSLTVVGAASGAKWERKEDAQAFVLAGPTMRVRVDKSTGAVSFLDVSDHLLLRETSEGRKITPATQKGVTGTACAQSFALQADEGIYGLGQHQKGLWNYRAGAGTNIRLAQANTDVGVPVITSSKGYVLLWDDPAVTNISISPGSDSDGEVRWSSEFGRAIDYYFCYGKGDIGSALKAYRQLTGDAPLMPRWLLGFWQCKERYASQAELLGVAKKYRDLKVPIDGIIQDWQYWPPGQNTWGSHLFDPARYPDPAGMFKELHAMNYHALISVWAKFDVGSENSKELNDNGGMFPQVTTYAFPPGKGQWYDPFNPKGRETYWRQIHDEIFSKGVDGWWLDAPEPEIGGMGFRGYATGAGPGYEVYNAYPLMHSQGIHDGQRAATDEKRVVILTRSAYAGQQRNSAITWSGDITGNWRTFKNQIPAGLNFSFSGIPYWNTDTGGFFGDKAVGRGDPGDPLYQEIFTRWFQFSAFCPMFRVHGSYGLKPGKEIDRFDERTQQIMRTYLNLRYRLLPYLYSTAWQVTSEGSTFMRPLVMDFPNDKAALDVGNQYLFGPSILVTPVTTQHATTQPVYLPQGTQWYDFWTGASQPGGQISDSAAPIETLPLFVRSGSILPMGPLMQYSSEKAADPIELRVYPGANGTFTLYEDEGDSYRYEKGARAIIPLAWDDASKTLTIGKRQGEFPGMLKERQFNVVLVSPGHGSGVEIVEKPELSVHYNGEQTKVQLTH